jgi:hypothetical protein
MDYPIEQFLASYEQLKTQYRNHQISQEQFAETVKQMRGKDANGVYWAVDPYRDNYFRFDGQQWVADDSIKLRAPIQPAQPVRPVQSIPQAASQQTPAATGQFVDVPVYSQAKPVPEAEYKPAPQSQVREAPVYQQTGPIAGKVKKPVLSRKGIKGIPFLALIPGLFCGGAWFLYTFVGVFKTEGLRGIDILTPAFIVLVPAAFWLFGKQIDKSLKPLVPLIGPFPKPLRYGIILGVPVLLGCGCSLISRSGYGLLNLSTLISALVAGILMRIPEVKK